MTGAVWPAGPMILQPPANRPLLILSCSDTKAKVADPHTFVRFFDLYDGPMWRQIKTAGFPIERVAAISALHGFMEPGMPIRPYDAVMDEERARSFVRTSNHCWRLAEIVKRAGSALVVGGKNYRAVAEGAVAQHPEIADRVTCATGSFLEQRKLLGEWLREQATATAASARSAVVCGKGCGREWPRDPCLEVKCPVCQAAIGVKCRRPSGHGVWGPNPYHADRDILADQLGHYGPCPRGACGLDPGSTQRPTNAAGDGPIQLLLPMD